MLYNSLHGEQWTVLWLAAIGLGRCFQFLQCPKVLTEPPWDTLSISTAPAVILSVCSYLDKLSDYIVFKDLSCRHSLKSCLLQLSRCINRWMCVHPCVEAKSQPTSSIILWVQPILFWNRDSDRLGDSPVRPGWRASHPQGSACAQSRCNKYVPPRPVYVCTALPLR